MDHCLPKPGKKQRKRRKNGKNKKNEGTDEIVKSGAGDITEEASDDHAHDNGIRSNDIKEVNHDKPNKYNDSNNLKSGVVQDSASKQEQVVETKDNVDKTCDASGDVKGTHNDTQDSELSHNKKQTKGGTVVNTTTNQDICAGDYEYAKRLSEQAEYDSGETKDHAVLDWKVFKKHGKGKNATKVFYQDKTTSDKVTSPCGSKSSPVMTSNQFKVLDDQEELPTSGNTWKDRKQESSTAQKEALSSKINHTMHSVSGATTPTSAIEADATLPKDPSEDWDLYPEEDEVYDTLVGNNAAQPQLSLQNTEDMQSLVQETSSQTTTSDKVPVQETNDNDFESVLEEETKYDNNKTITLRVEHVLRNGRVFENPDHQRVLKTITTWQPVKVQAYELRVDNAGLVYLKEVAKYADD